MPDTATEIELKLAVAPDAVTKLRAHPALKAAGPGATRRLRTTYFDTPELALRGQGVALRLRRAGRRWIQTVKAAGVVHGGLHQWPQQETELARGLPDCDAIIDAALTTAFASPELRSALEPRFVTDFRRTTWMVRPAPDTLIEASLDRGEIRAGARGERLCELELELKAGAPWRLYQFALALAGDVSLQLDNRSKAERGYALLEGRLPEPVKAGPSTARLPMNATEGFTAIVWAAFDQIQANAPGVIGGEDPEYIHQMRVGVRRLRSAFRVFEPLLPRDVSGAHAMELRWLGRALGPARDWDVFLTETYPPLRDAFDGNASLAEFERGCVRRRDLARRAARRAVASPRYQRLMLGLAMWLSAAGWTERLEEPALLALEQPLQPFAASELERRYRQVRRRGRKLGSLDAAQRHALRIALKRLRYAADFFAPLCNAETVGELLGRLSRLQDILGIMNDATTAERLVAEVSGDAAAGPAAEARGIVLGWSRGRALTLQRELRRAWKAFRESERPWQ